MTLESLRSLIIAAKNKNPRKPRYSEAIKKGVRFFNNMPTGQLAQKVGVSNSFISKVRKTAPTSISGKTPIKSKIMDSELVADTPMQFFQIDPQLSAKNSYSSEKKPSMKVTTPLGLVIEIWG